MSEALQYLTDEAGKKTAVVLPITDYEKLLEDLDDLAAIARRREEPTVSHDQFKAELRGDSLRSPLSRMRKTNQHSETGWGGPAGREVW